MVSLSVKALLTEHVQSCVLQVRDSVKGELTLTQRASQSNEIHIFMKTLEITFPTMQTEMKK